ncbi:unnamed protein product [Caenorhabditis auriculariae]|uniref:C6 domain-containing protein n=1 Tax=Caenorhabditis auriculariae TaxID=2777116 RepID=A0A8S1HAR5_9PELO|nr:unnamed protein product [Caenorhabditis auriculariae]
MGVDFMTDAAGCVSMVASCTADPDHNAYMQFNIDQGGPLENMAMPLTVRAPLQCINGKWNYVVMGAMREVMIVSCMQAKKPLAVATMAARTVRTAAEVDISMDYEGKKSSFLEIHRKMSSSTVLTVFAALVASANGLLWLQWGGDANARAYE